MNGGIYILKASGRLIPFSKKIEEIIKKVKSEVVQLLPLPDLDVIVEDNPLGAIEHLGIGGYAQNTYLINLYLDPKFPNINNSIAKNLPRILAHELHHAIRWQNPGYGKTLLEALVSEGLADHFEMEYLDGEPEKWDLALTEKQLQKFSELAKKEFTKEYDHNEWFFGMGDRNIPKWTGYTLGFNIVKKYLEKYPEKKPSQLYSIQAQEVVK
ncbi:hypothetical protein HYS91_00625 [Candidatus Daviesbacteria bacterium]|nr:hypothetical protein [Candidatus Daviesbacteria bacterium]